MDYLVRPADERENAVTNLSNHGVWQRTLVAASLILLFVPAATEASRQSWSVTVVGAAGDPRLWAVTEAVDHWNEQLARLSASVRFGPISRSDEQVSDDLLRTVSEAILGRERPGSLPSQLASISGDVIVFLSGAELISVGIPPARFGKSILILRRADVPPLSLPNVARNVVAHELGHVLGLPHNSDPATLMCGRPAPCRPPLFRSDTAVFFPLTETERRALAVRWR